MFFSFKSILIQLAIAVVVSNAVAIPSAGMCHESVRVPVNTHLFCVSSAETVDDSDALDCVVERRHESGVFCAW